MKKSLDQPRKGKIMTNDNMTYIVLHPDALNENKVGNAFQFISNLPMNMMGCLLHII